MSAMLLELLDLSKLFAHWKRSHKTMTWPKGNPKKAAVEHAKAHAMVDPGHRHGGIIMSVQIDDGRFQNGREHKGQPEGDFTGQDVNGAVRDYGQQSTTDSRKPARGTKRARAGA